MKKAKDLNELASQHMANILIVRIYNKVACNFRLEDLKFRGKTWLACIRKKKSFWNENYRPKLFSKFPQKKLSPFLQGYCPISKAKFEQDKKQTKQGMFLKKLRKL